MISTGLKRYIAALLAVVIEALRLIPGTADLINVITTIAGGFGVLGIGHAAFAGTLHERILATASAAITVLMALSYFFPALEPLRPYLEQIAALIGASAFGARMKESPTDRKLKLAGPRTWRDRL